MMRIIRSSLVKAKFDSNQINVNACAKRLKLSRSSYYLKSNQKREAIDVIDVRPIQTLFSERKERVGIRQIQMLLERRFEIKMNRKKIARLKNKFGLITRIRRASKYRRVALAQLEHQTCKNILDRNFTVLKPDQVYSTDITEIKFANGTKKAFLAAFKDLATNEIISSQMTSTPSLELVCFALRKAVERLPEDRLAKLMIHSDQGLHFTHISYRDHLRKRGITQSMSRRGNCLDNAPIESFFGHLKDHLDTKEIETIEELKKHVTAEINYYNRERPQLRLKKMPPVFYRRHLELEERFI